MKKAIIVGGSNGVGLAIGRNLIDRGYYLEICDRCTPEKGILPCDLFHYNYCDLLDFNEDFFADLAADADVELLMITAGVGRVADFYAHHIAEIEKMLTVDTVSVIKILRIFYERILAEETFYTGVMGSISGWMSSPAASVYAAAKAGLVRFVESVNIELELAGTDNRILDVSPASFKGSRFYGGRNDLPLPDHWRRRLQSIFFLVILCSYPNMKRRLRLFLKGIIMIPMNMACIVISTRKIQIAVTIARRLK